MRFVVVTIVLAFTLLTGTAMTVNKLSSVRESFLQEQTLGLVIPSSVARIVSLEFKGLFSDVIFFRTMSYYGAKLIRGEHLTDEEWEWIYKNVDVATDLDPYFLDPYYFGAMNLAWDGNNVYQANMLLMKATTSRDWDWTPPFYLGFNYFFFLRDDERASVYLMEAAKRPGGSSGIVPTLAARMTYNGKRTESAVLFLDNIVRKTKNDATKKILETRLDALNKVLYLERASNFFRKKFGRYPSSLVELVAKGVLREVPQDPYGGTFYIDSEGNIKTTSDFIVQKTKK